MIQPSSVRSAVSVTAGSVLPCCSCPCLPIGSGCHSIARPVRAAAAFITFTHSGTTSWPMSSPSSTPIFTRSPLVRRWFYWRKRPAATPRSRLRPGAPRRLAAARHAVEHLAHRGGVVLREALGHCGVVDRETRGKERNRAIDRARHVADHLHVLLPHLDLHGRRQVL